VVDKFGIFGPQVVFTILAIIAILFFGSAFLKLEDLPLSAWHLSDAVVKKKAKKD
jgi:hypothetical protein